MMVNIIITKIKRNRKRFIGILIVRGKLMRDYNNNRNNNIRLLKTPRNKK